MIIVKLCASYILLVNSYDNHISGEIYSLFETKDIILNKE